MRKLNSYIFSISILSLALGISSDIRADYHNYDPNSSGRYFYTNQNDEDNNYNGNQGDYRSNSYQNSNRRYRNQDGYQSDNYQSSNRGYNQNPYQSNTYQDSSRGYNRDDYQNSNYQDSSRGYRNDSRNEGVSDQELTKKIRDKIGSGWFSRGYEDVNFRVNNGVVTLQGSVQTESDKEKVEKEIRNLNGVRSLNSNLMVQEKSKNSKEREFPQDRASSKADDQLNKKIRDNISKGWLKDSYKDIGLDTNDGVVTLDGSIKNADDQQKVINDVLKVEGVRSVKSNLQIRNR